MDASAGAGVGELGGCLGQDGEGEMIRRLVGPHAAEEGEELDEEAGAGVGREEGVPEEDVGRVAGGGGRVEDEAREGWETEAGVGGDQGGGEDGVAVEASGEGAGVGSLGKAEGAGAGGEMEEAGEVPDGGRRGRKEHREGGRGDWVWVGAKVPITALFLI